MIDVDKMINAKDLKELKKYADELQKRINKAQRIYKAKVPYAGEMHKIIPVGAIASAKIDHKVTTEREVLYENLISATSNRPDRICQPGTYTRLMVRRDTTAVTEMGESEWCIMMTDAPYELRSSKEFIKRAHGHVLVAGLGLGATLLPVLKKKSVHSVTVLEKSGDVVTLVLPHIRKQKGAEKMTVLLADATRWPPPRGERYNTIWLDIWPDISTHNLLEMRLLKKKFEKFLAKGGWLGVWEWEYLHQLEKEHLAAIQGPLSAVGGDVSKGFPPLKDYYIVDGRKVKI
jgi:hypothetical protein